MTKLPSLGPRGEGWVAIQFALLTAAVVAGFSPGAWTGTAGWLAPAAGLVLGLAGATLFVSGIAALQRGSAMTPLPRPREDGRLVQSGPFGLVRHPVYGGLILGALGWGLIRQSIPALVAAVVLLVFFDLKRRREEAWLLTRFPDYAAYRSRTRRLIPWVY